MQKNQPVNNRTTLFDDLQKGLIQTINYAKGAGSARVIPKNVNATKNKDKEQHSENNNSARNGIVPD